MSYYEERLASCLEDGKKHWAVLVARGASEAEIKSDLALERYRQAWRFYDKLVAAERMERLFPSCPAVPDSNGSPPAPLK